MTISMLQRVKLLAGGLVLVAGAAAGAMAPAASAQVVCSDPVPTASCPIVINGGQAYNTTTYVTGYDSFGNPIMAAPAYDSFGNPIMVNPTYVSPAVVTNLSAEPVVTAGSESYVSMGGAYCTLADGGQVWVPAGAPSASYGC